MIQPDELEIEECPHKDENTGRPQDTVKFEGEAQSVRKGKFTGTRWVQCNKGDEVWCRPGKSLPADPRAPPIFAARFPVPRVARDGRGRLLCFLARAREPRLLQRVVARKFIGEWPGQLRRVLDRTAGSGVRTDPTASLS